MQNKPFDCVKMKLEIQGQIFEETKHLNLKEFVNYIHRKTQKSELWRKLRTKKQVQQPTTIIEY